MVAAYNEAFLKNLRGAEASESDDEDDDFFNDDDEDEDDYDDRFNYGDTASGTFVRTSKQKKQGGKVGIYVYGGSVFGMMFIIIMMMILTI